MPSPALLSVSLTALIFAGLIPVMEVNDTHLFNPEWPSHARLHEAWQLLTNAVLCVLAVVIVWNGRAPKLGIAIALTISLSFLSAWVLGTFYGGSMRHTDGTELAIGGINVAVLIVLAVVFLLLRSLRADVAAEIE